MHARVLVMDKNIENPLNNKYLLSLGEDEIIDQSTGAVSQKALVFKIWDFISLDSKYLLPTFIFLTLHFVYFQTTP